jgi:hypothetical protein
MAHGVGREWEVPYMMTQLLFDKIARWRDVRLGSNWFGISAIYLFWIYYPDYHKKCTMESHPLAC